MARLFDHADQIHRRLFPHLEEDEQEDECNEEEVVAAVVEEVVEFRLR